MSVDIQLLTLVITFLFGGSTGVINKKISNKYRIVINVLIALSYFIILYLLNYGELHYYFIIMFGLGFYISSK